MPNTEGFSWFFDEESSVNDDRFFKLVGATDWLTRFGSKPKGKDMRRKQSDGTYLEDGVPCLDATEKPIIAGPCLTYEHGYAYFGDLLGAGRQGAWRVKNRKSGKVENHVGYHIIGLATGYRLKPAMEVARKVRWNTAYLYNPVVKQLIERANRNPASVDRVATAIIERFDIEIYMDLERKLYRQMPFEHIHVGSTMLPNAPSGVSVIASRHDSRIRLCGHCDCYCPSALVRTVSVIQRNRPPESIAICNDCVDGVRRTGRYQGLTCAITQAPDGATTFTLTIPRARINPTQVQCHSLDVSNALEWIGEGKFHLGLEIEGSAKRSQELLPAIYKAGLAIGKSDSSIRPNKGCQPIEVVTPPIAPAPEVYRPALAKLSKLLSVYGFGVNDSCGGHIHISQTAFTKGAIARLRYALAKYPAGWSLIFGRGANRWCEYGGNANRRNHYSHTDARFNVLDALSISGKYRAIHPTEKGTYEFRAFSSVYTLPELLAHFETVLALREWSHSMPTDWTLPGYLRFLEAHAMANAYSSKLTGKAPVDPFLSMVEDMKPKDAPPLYYARALAASAIFRIRMARVKTHKAPPVTVSKGKPKAKVRTRLDVAKEYFERWLSVFGTYGEIVWAPPAGPGISHCTIYWAQDYMASSSEYVEIARGNTVAGSSRHGTLILLVPRRFHAEMGLPYTGATTPTPAVASAIDRNVLTLAI